MNAITKPALGAAPCPFCGGRGLHVEGDAPEGLWGVECDNDACAASGPRGFDSPEAAVTAWNRSGSAKVARDMIAVLTRLRENMDAVSRDPSAISRGDSEEWAHHHGYFEGIDYALSMVSQVMAEVACHDD